ncbi:MAG: hypothetical protein IJ729_00365 [Alloprevotella sp.]|nr:hypothetical protein [Alloprevotella sp.]
MKHSALLSAALLGICTLLSACLGEDRTDEQPFPPTVRTLAASVRADSCLLHGVVLASPNSRVTGRGFYYGNDTLRVQRIVASDGALGEFLDTVVSMLPGDYYACAFAANGMGVVYGDTLRFRIE